MALTLFNQDAGSLMCGAVGSRVIGLPSFVGTSFVKRFVQFDLAADTASVWEMTLPNAVTFGATDVGGGAVWGAAATGTSTTVSAAATMVAVYPGATPKYDFWLPPSAVRGYPTTVYCGTHVLVANQYGIALWQRLNLSTGVWDTLSAPLPMTDPRYGNGFVWFPVSSTAMGKLNPVTGAYTTVTIAGGSWLGTAGLQRSVVYDDIYYWISGSRALIQRFDINAEVMLSTIAVPAAYCLGASNGHLHIGDNLGMHSMNLATGAIVSEPISGHGIPASVVGHGDYAYAPYPTR